MLFIFLLVILAVFIGFVYFFSKQKQIITDIQNKFEMQFENLSNKIFDEKINKFTTFSNNNFVQILNPFKEKINDFERRIENIYQFENKERISLKEQISQLSLLNQQMSNEAKNLTQALNGDNKVQGNWGEMILEKILEKSGLQENQEYFLQYNHYDRVENSYKRPDVVINLPENKIIIIDAKVSLLAYQKLVVADSDTNFNDIAKEHVNSIKFHIKNLKDKEYQKINADKSLEFILMFIPIESAFSMAIKFDNSILDLAYSNNIIIVSPVTLLATLKTVYQVWRTEKSYINANEIAKVGGEIYDKVCLIIESIENLDKAMVGSNHKLMDLKTKISGERGLAKSALKLKDLGSKTSKEKNLKGYTINA